MTNWRVVVLTGQAAVGAGAGEEEADEERAGDVYEQDAPRKHPHRTASADISAHQKRATPPMPAANGNPRRRAPRSGPPGIARDAHGYTHLPWLRAMAAMWPSQTEMRHVTTEAPTLAPAPAHSPSRTRFSVCRLNCGECREAAAQARHDELARGLPCHGKKGGHRQSRRQRVPERSRPASPRGRSRRSGAPPGRSTGSARLRRAPSPARSRNSFPRSCLARSARAGARQGGWVGGNSKPPSRRVAHTPTAIICGRSHQPLEGGFGELHPHLCSVNVGAGAPPSIRRAHPIEHRGSPVQHLLELADRTLYNCTAASHSGLLAPGHRPEEQTVIASA